MTIVYRSVKFVRKYPSTQPLEHTWFVSEISLIQTTCGVRGVLAVACWDFF